MSGSAGIVLLTQQPAGSFVPSSVTTSATSEVEVGDVDGDSRADVVGFQGGMVNVYHHTVAGWNRTDHDTVRGYWPNVEGIEVADVTGDGRADVIATIGGNSPGSRVNVFAQNAAGGLDAPSVYLTRDVPEPVEAADITGDSRTDVVTAHGGWNTLSVIPQLANGTLGTPNTSSIPYASHYDVQGLALGDINGDDRVDAVIADYNYGLVVLRNASGPAPGGGAVVDPVDRYGRLRDRGRGEHRADGDLRADNERGLGERLDGATGARPHPAGRAGHGDLQLRDGDRDRDADRAAAGQHPVPARGLGVRDQAGATQTERFTSTFRTLDTAPRR
jgi:hypothetical protein